ncbi:MAG: aldo/keto reductase family protein [Actinomycetes bacterium]
MEFRRLGRSGLKISEITYGNWLTHGAQIDDDAARAVVHAALDVGITTFDTADVYAQGKAESALGKALRGQRREGLEIFSKVYWPTGSGVNDRGLSRKHIMESCHATLRRLETDYLDLYQAHRFDYEAPLDEVVRAFDDLVRQGKVLYVGVSEWKASQIRGAVELQQAIGADRLVSNQPEYSMLWRVIEAEVVPTSQELGVSQIVWSPMAQGVLTGKYQPGQAPPAGSRAADPEAGGFLADYLKDDVLNAVQGLRPIADEVGVSMATLAIAWVLQNPNVAAAIVGASRPEQIRENAQAAGLRLEPQVLQRIDEVLSGVVERDPGQTESPEPRA